VISRRATLKVVEKSEKYSKLRKESRTKGGARTSEAAISGKGARNRKEEGKGEVRSGREERTRSRTIIRTKKKKTMRESMMVAILFGKGREKRKEFS